MKILLLTSEFAPLAGGIGTYAGEIARAATELGAEVTAIAPDYGHDSRAADGLLPFAVRRYRGGVHSMRQLPAKIALARARIAADRYDIVHAADWPFFIPVAMARRLTNARIVMTVHGTEINEVQTPLKRLAIRAARVFAPGTLIAANSDYTRELFQSRFPIQRQHVRAIPLGVSDFWFADRKPAAETRSALRIDADRVVMVTVARLTRRKGHLLTLKALARLSSETRRQLTWLIIGPDGEPDYVAELRAAAAAADCDIRFLGALPSEDIRDIYGASDFFCLTGIPEASGRVEGFGLVYLEAGAAGLPSLATDIGGVSDAVVHGEAGLLLQPAADAIGHAMARLAENGDLRRSLATGALANAWRLSWRRCAAETYGLAQSERRDPASASGRAQPKRGPALTASLPQPQSA
jgi:glycosyltransferase involved in cell wall biosynthesis